jgi:hypothetical protein
MQKDCQREVITDDSTDEKSGVHFYDSLELVNQQPGTFGHWLHSFPILVAK